MTHESRVTIMLKKRVAYTGWEISMPLYILTDPTRRRKMFRMPGRHFRWTIQLCKV